MRERKRREVSNFLKKGLQQRSGTNSKAKQGTDFEANQQQEESVQYGFGTARFTALVMSVQQHANRGNRPHLMIRTCRATVVQQH
jgi:hypothetical protein